MAASSHLLDKSSVPREILITLIDGIYPLLNEKELWLSTDGLAEELSAAKRSALMTLNPQTVYDAAKKLQSEIISKLNMVNKNAEALKTIINDSLTKMHIQMLEHTMANVPTYLPPPPPPPPLAPKPSITRETAQANFLFIRESIRTIALDPKLIDNPIDSAAMSAWLPYHEHRVRAATTPSQLMRVITNLLKFMMKSSSDSVKVAKLFLIQQYKELETLAKIIGGKRKSLRRRKQSHKQTRKL